MKGKTFKYSVSVAVLATLVQATPTFASPVDLQMTQGQINATQGQIDNFETNMQQLDNQIIIGMDKSQKLNNEIKVQQGRIEETKTKIEQAKKDFDSRKEVYSERLRSYQSQGQQQMITYAELLLSSENISEFLTRSTAISQFLQSDADLLKSLNEKEQALNDAEQQLHSELDNLKKNQDALASEQKKIETAKQEIEKKLANSKNILQQQQVQLAQQQAEQLAQQKAQQEAQQKAQQEAQQKAQQEAQQKAQQEAQQKAQQEAQQKAQQKAQQEAQQQALQLPKQNAQQQAQQQVPKQSLPNNSSLSAPSTGGASLTDTEKANKVIAFAEQYLGVPYVWGGSSPSGFDCSGLMQYVFHSVGVNLPRVSNAQQNVGIRISPSQVQPGDLVFKGDPAYHVGMYIGGGQWIQAPETGDVVKISSYNPSSFASASRVLR
ncbi:NlpC/P60 family protein [Bacillus sp. EB600]|uniref:C40 family peptidase n=1 Tax=Bacillus sp. EB600 TaxID=2806345 RepID=UPI00210D0996|nr:C40 family peptidase [Bacillus sp. EB600]MCQ6280628.1 C40 family peptidase [Bacillus sp. EB600]